MKGNKEDGPDTIERRWIGSEEERSDSFKISIRISKDDVFRTSRFILLP
jgi:hypothetical protein